MSGPREVVGPRPPEEVAQDVWEQLQPVLTEVLGAEAAERFRSSVQYENFVRSPLGFSHDLLKLVEHSAGSPEAVAPWLPKLIGFLNRLTAERDAHADRFREHPAYVETERMLRQGVDRLGGAQAYELGRAALHLDAGRVVLPASHSVVGVSRPELSFEAWARFLSGEVAHVVETFYRPMLAALLSVTKGKPVPVVEVGKLMQQGRDVWEAATADALLPDDLRVARNAVAHGQVSFDLAAQTITFENQRGDGTVQRVGPLSAEELRMFADWIFQGVLAMWSAFWAVLGHLHDAATMEELRRGEAELPAPSRR